MQNDFASRADWCVKPFAEANHPPSVKLGHATDLKAKAGQKVKLSAKGTTDPDGNKLTYRWWQYREAGSFKGDIEISNSSNMKSSFSVPKDALKGTTLHIICEVKDNGIPQLTRYQRVVVAVE